MIKQSIFQRSLFPVAVGLIVILLAAAGCNMPGVRKEALGPSISHTQAAATLMAQLTPTSGIFLPSVQRPAVTPPTATLPPTVTPLPTATAGDVVILPPTTFPPPPPPPPPPFEPSPTPPPCNRAQFVQDVTVADGQELAAGTPFTKVWRLRNAGICVWSSHYSAVFSGGAPMNPQAPFYLPNDVVPGQVVDVAVRLTAPFNPGRYSAYYLMRAPDGQVFGLGDSGDNPFWVTIRSVAPTVPPGTAYDLAANLCSANWTSSAGDVPCPTAGDPSDGAVNLAKHPTLENGRQEDELTLQTIPQMVRDGWLTGVYPPYRVQPGDTFVADVGCLSGSDGCALTFSLRYQAPGEPGGSLGNWTETFDARLTHVEVSLNSLAGKTINLILVVTNAGRPRSAFGAWLAPAIRQGPLISPTATQFIPTATRTLPPPPTILPSSTLPPPTATATPTATPTLPPPPPTQTPITPTVTSTP